MPQLQRLPRETEEGRLPTAPSRSHAAAGVRAFEEGGASGRQVAAVGPNGVIASGRRGGQVLPLRIAPRLTPVPGLATGPTTDAARPLIATKRKMKRKARRQEARPPAVGVARLTASHPAEGRDKALTRAVEEVPVTAGAPPAAAALMVVTPRPRPLTAPLVTEPAVARLASLAERPIAPAVRPIGVGHASSRRRIIAHAIPLAPHGLEGPNVAPRHGPAKVRLTASEVVLGALTPVRPRATPRVARVAGLTKARVAPPSTA